MNKIVTSFCILIVICNFSISGQQLHNPAEILNILESSKISYNIDVLKEPVESPDFSDNLNIHNVYRIESDSGIFVYSYSLEDKAEQYFNKAEEYFTDRSLDSAITYYEKVLEEQPDYYKVMTYIGQMHGSLGRLDEALDWYKKVIEVNYIDYLAHYLIADIYRLKGDFKNAINEITIARILNRNNPRMAELQFLIYKKGKLKIEDYYFNPQYKITQNETGGVEIKMNLDWMGYALTKAVWEFEPGYKESMGVEAGIYSSLEDKEALLVLYTGLISIGKKTIKKNTDFKNLEKAIKNGYLTEFIIYEIVLPELPNVAYQLPIEQIETIKDYLLSTRHKK